MKRQSDEIDLAQCRQHMYVQQKNCRHRLGKNLYSPRPIKRGVLAEFRLFGTVFVLFTEF